MQSQILKAGFIYLFGLLTVTFSIAQTAPNEVLSAKGNYQAISVEDEMGQRIKRGDLITPNGFSAYDTYKEYSEEYPGDHPLKRKLKRSLVAALVDASDIVLTEYFDAGGEFILKYVPAQEIDDRSILFDEYYYLAAELLGEDHYLFSSLMSKGCFMEALKFRYIENKGFETIKKKLEESIALDSTASYTFNELGTIYFEGEEYPLACENYNQAIKLNSYWELPQQNLKMAKETMALKESKNKKG